jgi:ketosteroid isomerase-like protein
VNPAVERFAAAFDAKDVDAIMAAMTPDCVFEDTAPPDGTRHVGTDAVRTAWTTFFASSPEGVFTTEDVIRVRDGLVAEKLSYVKG